MTFLAGVLLIAIGPVVLHLLGPQYGSAWMLLLALVPALIVSCVTQVYYGVCRARGKLTEATGVAVFAGIIVIVPAALVLQQQGLGGVSILWLIAQIAAALVAGWRLYSLTRPGTTFFPAAARIHGPVDGGGTQ
jgi:O-antigen/teichoic acid export membrane protein